MDPPGRHRQPRTTVVFLAIGGLFGLALLVVSPPLYWGDENTHFAHAYRLSDLALELTPSAKGVTTVLPRGVGKLQLVLALDRLEQQRGTGRVAARKILDRLAIEASPADRRPLELVNSNYPLLGYLPQALGIALTRLWTPSVLLQLYGARLANLVVWLALMWAALRIAPAFRLPLAVLALSPMSLFVATTCAADALANALAFLWSALVIRLALGPASGSVSRALVAVVAVALTMVKLVYGTLLLLLLAVPAERLGGTARRRALIATLLAAAALCTAVWLAGARAQIASGIAHRGTDAFGTNLAVLADQPLRVARMVAATVLLHGEVSWIYHLTDVMWGIVAPPALIWVWLAGVVAALIAERRSDPWPSPRSRAVALAIALLCLSAVALSAFLFWSLAGAGSIAGFQGRYAIPLLPALLLVVCPPATRPAMGNGTRCALSAAALLLATSLLAYTVMRGVRLYG